MVRNNKATIVWKTYGDDAAQLFRDFYFEKYPYNISPKDVHADPDRPYRFYNARSFYTHVATCKNRVLTYKQLGTGLNNEAFVKKLRLHQKPTPEERGAKPTRLLQNLSDSNNNNNISGFEDYDSLDDETYKTIDCEESDVPLSSVFEVESCFGTLSLEHQDDNKEEEEEEEQEQEEEEEEEEFQQKPAMIRAGTLSMSDDFNNELGVKYLEALPDGRLAAVVQLPSGFDGHFAISDDGKKVLMKSTVHPAMLSAERCYAKLGLTGNSAFVVAIQSKINAMIEGHNKKAGSNSTKIQNEKVVFKLPFEVKRTFFNKKKAPKSTRLGLVSWKTVLSGRTFSWKALP
jgi:hypothetical protein